MLPGASPIKAALLSAAFLFAFLTGCSSSGSFRSAREIAAWADQQGFFETVIRSGVFSFTAFARKPSTPSETLTIYIEGDGAAWPTPYHPPHDPTPARPVALALAAADTSSAVVYLGRPCQYLDATELRSCDSAYWTERRFAADIVAAYDGVINQQKSALAARRIMLIGYSGGGVLATLLAARRDDVEMLVTVASPLAVNEWTRWHGASSLTGSLDPAELGENVRLPRSVHFVGAEDKIVPPAIVDRFVRRKGGRIEVIPDFDHECCWVRQWATLLGRATFQEVAR